jgi:hypothetical protein
LSTVRRAERVDVDADRIRVANRVGELHFAALRELGSHDVLCNPTTHVGGAAIDLRGILARERATAVTAHAAVRIDDDLASGEAGVTLRSADDEAAGWIDEELGLVVEELRGQDLLITFSMQNFSISLCETSGVCCVEMTTLAIPTGLLSS